ncbi:UvrD-helicase domain-containing protein [Meiothermus ruber]|uniref:DNA 3'-5' helicase n=3 Tax=Meiothermus ruber TaxID=277 RepID=A0A806CWU3_MEIRD|nr:UvrD/REP helicase [Meiothermus ruber DSM 1279]MCL6530339.1 AAA family ATPase [Meiothermus ruber]GAO74951.1 UvrD/REP helicase [Meiothermus ruber H328]
MTGSASVCISESFYKGKDRLNQMERGQIMDALLSFFQDPSYPSLRLEKIHNDFWSIRASRDLRIILTRQAQVWIAAYCGHHDEAYRWAERRRVEVHPQTGDIQIVRIPEVDTPSREPPANAPLARFDEDYLLSLGVPQDYVKPLRYATEDGVLELLDGLPQAIQERILDLLDGKPVIPPPKIQVQNAEELLAHPMAQRQFVLLRSLQEVRQALQGSWEAWHFFLHPLQQEVVGARFGGPARVTGGAGTGKTVVAIHRARTLAQRYPQARILLTTFNKGLARKLKVALKGLAGEELPNVWVDHLHNLALRLHEEVAEPVQIWTEEKYRPILEKLCQGLPYSSGFLLSEWEMADAWGLYIWEAYRGFSREGRGTPLSARERQALFEVFQRVWETLRAQGAATFSGVCHRVRAALEEGHLPRFRAVVADETQDFGPAELMLLRALAEEGEDDLFLTLDPAQRIYRGPTSWRALGLEVQGRSRRLRVNYRTTREIGELAERTLPSQVEGEARGSLALLRGPTPEQRGFNREEEALKELLRWVRWLLGQGLEPRQIAVLARVHKLAESVGKRLLAEGLPAQKLDEDGEGVWYGTVHAAKGLEFRAVALFGASADLFPLKILLNKAADLQEKALVEEKERSLLYVALSRPREYLWVGYWGEPSPYLPS